MVHPAVSTSARLRSALVAAVVAAVVMTACSSRSTLIEPVSAPSRVESALVPAPRHASWTGENLQLGDTLRCHVASDSLRALIPVIDGELNALHRVRVVTSDSANAACHLSIDRSLDVQEYHLRIGDRIRIHGGSYNAVAMGTVTMVQAAHRASGGRPVLPRGEVEDRPRSEYRGVLIDVAREWHDVSVLEQLIVLARWYKVNHLQLHLTDDESFTFPTAAYPALPTPDRHYTKEQLRALDEFARVRGVALVPELEVPGHAGQFTSRLPQVFAIRDRERNPGTINMGRDTAYAALDQIVGEIADVFRTSPYIHIGGDEARRDHLEDDPHVQRYLARHRLPSVEELYRHFLVRVDSMVRRHGKQTILWEGFHKNGMVEIPRHILVMAWETMYQLPQDLLANGYTVINASWKPLYVTKEKKWPVEYIYDVWNIWRWENWVPTMPSIVPIQLAPTPQVIGASMEAWAQRQEIQLHTLRRRLAAMSERTWNSALEPERPLASFLSDLAVTDDRLERILTPVRAHASGLAYPDVIDGHYGEHAWFRDSVTVVLQADDDYIVRYTLDGTEPGAHSPTYTSPIARGSDVTITARAFSSAGAPIGYTRSFEYQLHPLSATLTGWTGTPPEDVWEIPGRAVSFTDSLVITLSSSRPGTVRYTTDRSAPEAQSRTYVAPIRLGASAVVRARLFDAGGRPVGREWEGRFHRLTAQR